MYVGGIAVMRWGSVDLPLAGRMVIVRCHLLSQSVIDSKTKPTAGQSNRCMTSAPHRGGQGDSRQHQPSPHPLSEVSLDCDRVLRALQAGVAAKLKSAAADLASPGARLHRRRGILCGPATDRDS